MKLPPVASSCLLALGIDCISNVIAQRMKAWRDGAPFVFDRVLFLQMAILVTISAPINFYWQNWLERAFPGWKMEKKKRTADTSLDAEEKQVFLKDDGEDKKVVDEEVRVRNWWNIFRKWFTDCITMGALLNTTMFLVVMGILKGKSGGMIWTDVRNEELKIIWDSYKVWPIANFFSTTYCPVERRIVFLSGCGLVWNIYLTLVAARL
ncbi:hypothetical protein BDV95DRAFT_613284 [Massariosphaeria phaeospora]|uniref:Integral membrane protein-like protein n=1 Tax=Massariosphaeria phaeospora TaxID=100035 RepID=A0A7C8HYC7_9PLEO|nr:hypothetical protein BDV95DRAFT_613284 [Massariosphaeria phaeospora]